MPVARQVDGAPATLFLFAEAAELGQKHFLQLLKPFEGGGQPGFCPPALTVAQARSHRSRINADCGASGRLEIRLLMNTIM